MSLPMTTPEQLVEALGIPFSSQQLDAICAPLEPGVIIAGAGSGKTTVMAARVVWLVATGAVQPDEVLGLTFTRKAAAELAARVRAALLRSGAVTREGLDESGEQLVLTYDAFAARLVNDHGIRLGFEPDARTISGAQRFRLASRAVNAASGPFAHISRVKPNTVVERVLMLDANLTSHLASTDEVRAETAAFTAEVDAAPPVRGGRPHSELLDARARAHERDELAGLVDDYQRLKRSQGTVEFADQMALAARLAREVPEVGAALRAQFRVVLLDEYQDTSSAQAQLLHALFSGPDAEHGRGHAVTAVGDPCQAIYGWRGAAASNIITFADTFLRADGAPAHTFPLTVNRRSGQTILDAANALSAPLRSDPALQWDGLDVDLVAPEGTPPGDIAVATFDTQDAEVAWVADRIAASHDTGLVRTWSDIAVLTRRNAAIGPLYAALQARGVPVEIVGLSGLLALPEVADTVAVLRVLGDVSANPDLVRVLTGPRWAIGPADLAVLGRRAVELAGVVRRGTADFDEAVAQAVSGGEASSTVSLAEALDDPGEGYSVEGAARLDACAAELRALRRHAGDPVTDLVRRVINQLGLDVELALRGGEGSRQLQAFVSAVSAYVDVDGDSSLGGLLAYLRAEEEFGDGLEQAVVAASDSVKLMTMHKSKGLEWELVFLPSLADKVFPSDRVTDNWLKAPAMIPAGLRGDADSVPQVSDVTKPAFDAYAAALKTEARRGDDRLAYVAVTRARQHLVATSHRWEPGLKGMRAESAYLRTLETFGAVVHADELTDENPYLGASGARVPWPQPWDEAAFEARLAVARAVDDVRDRARAGAADEPDALPTLDDEALVATWDAAADTLLAEARAQRRGVEGVVLPPYLSATALIALRRDAEAFTAELVRPMPRPPRRAGRVGEAFHGWLERRFGAPAALVDDDEVLGDADLARLIERFERGQYADRTPTHVEVPFALFLGGQVLRGRIDAVFEGPSGVQIVDWKTGGARRADPLQLAVYRLAWCELTGASASEVDAVFYDVLSDEIVRPDRLPGRDELDALVRGLAGGA